MLTIITLRHTAISIIFLFAFFSSFSNNSVREIDSLRSIISFEKSDSAKVLLIIKLGDALSDYRQDSAIYYYEQAISLAKKISHKQLQADATRQMGVFYRQLGHNPKAKVLYNEALAIFEALNDKAGISKCYSNLGASNLMEGNYDEAREYFSKSNKIYTEINDKKGISSSFTNLGVIEDYLGNFDEAIDLYQKSLNIDIELNDEEGMAMCYNNIGAIHYFQKSYEVALDYFQKSLELKSKFKDKRGMAGCYLNIASIYDILKESQKAMDFNLMALDIAIEQRNEVLMAQCYSNMGSLYSTNGDYDLALEYHNKEMMLKSKTGDKKGLITALSNIAEVHIKIAKNTNLDAQSNKMHYRKCIEYGESALTIAKEIKSMTSIYEVCKNLFIGYRKLDMFDKATEAAGLVLELQDSIYADKKASAIQEMEAKYQNETKRLEIENLENEHALMDETLARKEVENNKQRMALYFIISGLLIFVLFSIFLYRLLVQKKRANQLLSRQKEEIMQQKEEIHCINDQLHEVNKELEKLSIIASKTDNAVASIGIDGKLQWVNDGFYKMYGYNLDEFIELYGDTVFEASKNPEINEIINRCIGEKVSVQYNFPAVTKEGINKWIQTTMTPLMDSDDQVLRLIAIDTDISKQKEAENEILQQKEEILAQNEEIEATNNQLELINKELEQKNIQVFDSINYAKLIQDAILPSESLIKSFFPDSFLFYRPRNIVSGDFYWFSEKKGHLFLAVGDCTGHGVPGAFMSMIGTTLLSEIVNKDQIFDTSQILAKLNLGVTNALGQSGQSGAGGQDDGMEITLCRFDKDLKKVEISSANQTMFIFNNGSLQLIRGDMFSIGGNMLSGNKNVDFTKCSFSIVDRINLYLFTDGYVDQFGGEGDLKFLTSRLKNLLETNLNLSMEEQGVLIKETFDRWKGCSDQIDDVTFIGIKI